MALDKENYQYALVTGPNRDYLWVLARRPDLNAEVVEQLIATADSLGYPTDDLIWVEHHNSN